VINVSWDDARAYADWLSDQTGQRYRLPTEAEWEYAARAGTTTPFWTGDCIHTDQANYDGNYDYNGCGAKTGVHRGQTVPAGSLPANAFGLHEIAGNVWEWVEDCWHSSYAGAPTDGSAWVEADGGECSRVVRGGS
jgi:formylglycine-generating enzyme required for sulfatase activity